MFIWSSPANTGTKLAKIRLKIINTLREWIWSWSYLPMIILHWGTGRYLMNWIQVVYFKLKEIWPLFSPAEAKKPSSFFYFPSAKAWKYETKSQSKGHEVRSQWKLLHWWTVRYLMNWIQVVYFKLKEIWPLFSPAKAKKQARLFVFFFEWKQISVAISPSAKNSMNLTVPYSEVSSPMTDLILSELLQYIGNMFKKFWM